MSHYTQLAEAFVRGSYPSIEITGDVLKYGLDNRLEKLHHFKIKDVAVIPRVKEVIGVLKPLWAEHVVDFGSQRGALLWPMMDQFMDTKFTAIDLDSKAYLYLNTVRRGGEKRLRVLREDVCKRTSLEDNCADAVVMSEILEHLEEPLLAAQEAVRISKGVIIVTVPNKEDDNPEHIQLFTEDSMKKLLIEAGVASVNTRQIKNCLMAIAQV